MKIIKSQKQNFYRRVCEKTIQEENAIQYDLRNFNVFVDELVRIEKESASIQNYAKTDYKNERLTKENIPQIASAICISALRVVYRNSADNTIHNDYISACKFANNRFVNDGKNGADYTQDIALYLMRHYDDYTKKGYFCYLDFANIDGYKDKNGNEISILIGAYRHLHKIIYRQKIHLLKNQYIEDIENQGEYIKIPFEYNIDDYQTKTTIDELVKALDLKKQQIPLLQMRLQGLSLADIAKKYKVSYQAIQCRMQQIQNKMRKIFPDLCARYGIK